MAFWNGEKLLETLPPLIEGFKKESIDCAAYTLSIGSEVYVSPSKQAEEPATQTIRMLSEKQAFTIPPGQFAFLLTKESVTIPPHALGLISMKASVKFRGLINVSGFHVDPGYRGRLIFAVFNAGPVPVHLREGDPCFLLWYADLNDSSRNVKTNDPVVALSAQHINGIAGELHSFESLATRIKDVEKAHHERIHDIENKLSYYQVVASVLLMVAMTVVGVMIKNCAESDTRTTPLRGRSAEQSSRAAVPPLAPAAPSFAPSTTGNQSSKQPSVTPSAARSPTVSQP